MIEKVSRLRLREGKLYKVVQIAANWLNPFSVLTIKFLLIDHGSHFQSKVTWDNVKQARRTLFKAITIVVRDHNYA